MASRQFGLVVFRALAIYLFCMSINYIYVLSNFLFMGDQSALRGYEIPLGQKLTVVGIWAIQVLISTFLWTNADKLVSPIADDQPSLRAGNWVVRLVFSSLGILICVYSVNSLVKEGINMVVPDPLMRDRDRDDIIYAVVESLRFAFGLGLFLVYRLDKVAVVQAAQALESPEPADDARR